MANEQSHLIWWAGALINTSSRQRNIKQQMQMNECNSTVYVCERARVRAHVRIPNVISTWFRWVSWWLDNSRQQQPQATAIHARVGMLIMCVLGGRRGRCSVVWRVNVKSPTGQQNKWVAGYCGWVDRFFFFCFFSSCSVHLQRRRR